MEEVYFHSFVYAILSYLATYLIGHILLSFVKVPARYPFLKEFSKMCAGLFTIITVYSIVCTHGITISVGYIFLFLMLAAWLKKNNYLQDAGEAIHEIISIKFLSYLCIQLLVLVLCFGYLFLKVKDPFSAQSYESNTDFYNYAIIIEHLNKTGIEGGYPDWYTGIIPIRNLYHYGELWYGAFYTLLTGQKAFCVFYFQLFAHCLVIYFLGASALIELFFQPKKKWVYGLSMLVFFICGISFYLPRSSIFTRGDWWDMGLVYQPKYFFTTLFVFYVLLFSKLQKYYLIVLVAMCTMLACSVSGPAMLLSIGFLLLILILSRKISFVQAIQWSAPVIVTLIFVGGYTVLIRYLNTKNEVIEDLPAKAVSLPLGLYLKTAFNCFAGQFIKSILSLFPYAILFMLFAGKRIMDRRFFKWIVLLLVIHVSSIAAYAIFCFLGVDTVQLWSIVYVPFSAIISFLVIIAVFNSKNIFLKILGVGLITLSLLQARVGTRMQRVNEQHLSRIQKMYDGSTAVTFMSEEVLSRDWSKNINLYPPAPYLKMYYNDYNTVCLSVFEVPESSDPQFQKIVEEIKKNAVFFRFVQLQKRSHEFISVEQSKKDFMKKYNVRYVFTYPNTPLPEYLKPLVIASSNDSIYDITLYQLKN